MLRVNMDWKLTQLTKPARDPFYNPILNMLKKLKRLMTHSFAKSKSRKQFLPMKNLKTSMVNGKLKSSITPDFMLQVTFLLMNPQKAQCSSWSIGAMAFLW